MVGRLVRVTFLDLSYFPHLGNAHDAVNRNIYFSVTIMDQLLLESFKETVLKPVLEKLVVYGVPCQRLFLTGLFVGFSQRFEG